jgi:hypothetical protein
MRFSAWKMKRMYTADSLMTVSKEVSKYKSYIVQVQGKMGWRW